MSSRDLLSLFRELMGFHSKWSKGKNKALFCVFVYEKVRNVTLKIIEINMCLIGICIVEGICVLKNNG